METSEGAHSFIENDEPRMRDECAGDSEALTLSAESFMGKTIRENRFRPTLASKSATVASTLSEDSERAMRNGSATETPTRNRGLSAHSGFCRTTARRPLSLRRLFGKGSPSNVTVPSVGRIIPRQSLPSVVSSGSGLANESQRLAAFDRERHIRNRLHADCIPEPARLVRRDTLSRCMTGGVMGTKSGARTACQHLQGPVADDRSVIDSLRFRPRFAAQIVAHLQRGANAHPVLFSRRTGGTPGIGLRRSSGCSAPGAASRSACV